MGKEDKSRIKELEEALKIALEELKYARDAGMFTQIDDNIIVLIENCLEK
jgi:hypothetical protein